MNVEQACRFRLDEGYSVFAKSPGILPVHEAALGNIFNSAMNNMFPQIGDSILSCTVEDANAYFARNTLRTDIHGRKTMFTHSYIFSAADYARMMEQDPMAILGVEMDTMLEIQSDGVQMPTLAAPEATASVQPVPALLEKYGLTPARYALLLLGAYQAITDNRSLQLVTSLPLRETAPMVREIILCILDGLLPAFKSKISFSTGPDTRMKISVISTENTSSISGPLLFGVDNDRYTNIAPRDEITAMVFSGLAAISGEDRKALLQKMQSWLESVVNLQEGVALALICAAYCMSSGMELDQNTLVTIFSTIAGAAGIAVPVKNTLLTGLVCKLNESENLDAVPMSVITDWYIGESSAEYRQEANTSMTKASEELCVALANYVFTMGPSTNASLYIKSLLSWIPADSPYLTDELKTHIVLWILRENETDYINVATELMESFSKGQQSALAQGILDNSRDRSLTQAEMAMLSNALNAIAGNGLRLPAEYESLLDAQSANYTADLNKSALLYLFRDRLAAVSPEEGLALLNYLRTTCPTFFPNVLIFLERGNAPAVWELYQTQECFREDPDIQTLVTLLQEKNTFNNPCGPFEKEAARHLEALIRADFTEKPAEMVHMSYYSDPIVPRWCKILEMLRLSDVMKAELKIRIAIIFWECVTMEQIYQNTRPLAEQVIMRLPETEDKLMLTLVCLELRKDLTNPASFIQLLNDPETPARQRAMLKEAANKMVFVLVNTKKFLSWDLLLLSAWQIGEKENGPDTKELQEIATRLDKLFEKKKLRVSMNIEDSAMLKDSKLRKSVAKLNIQSEVFQQLQDQIKPERGGLFGLFGGGDKKSDGKKAEDKKSGRGGPGGFNPADTRFGNDHKKGKK